MKKISSLAAIIAAAGLASCAGGSAPKATFNSELDSLSYSMGASNTQGLDIYFSRQLNLDSAYTSDFYRGIKEGASKTSDKDAAYIAGLQIGHELNSRMYEAFNGQLFGRDSELKLNKANFIAGFLEVMDKKGIMTVEEAQEYVKAHAETVKENAIKVQFAENKAAGEKFLAENAKKEGVKTTESGLQYKVIKEGKGEIPTKTSTVKVHYKGTLVDGTEFDSSIKRGEPTSFRADQVIKGWTEALTMMPVGSKWELYIPQELGYGSRNSIPTIKPFSTLIFEVELLEIEK